MKVKLTREQMEILKLTWLEMLEEYLRDLRCNELQYDFSKTIGQNIEEENKIKSLPLIKKESGILKDFELKMKVEMSFGNLFDTNDIYDLSPKHNAV